ncbi:Rieske (2Fe-2S) protein [Nocardioides panacisoli]|uniref:Rieske (2Fe-2S) protein n=1 Tax=Nocardioides panacisoli TaxID=627624 RepID=UPI001C62F5C3|nr:Rieske (2Fe-2S) protein [Nocardioides panacisoli]QYJ04961.1 Rieske (2Fe-2S) protein [Nocardioides panacisoli]
MNEQPRADRRIFFQGVGSLGVAAALAGCGSSDSGSDSGSGSDGGGGSAEAGTVLTPTGDVPVGGGVVLSDEQVVITQPTEGEFKAFTAVCTHSQCIVSTPADGSIPCNCHQSSYDAATGEVTGGPAPEALAEVAIEVRGDEIVTA